MSSACYRLSPVVLLLCAGLWWTRFAQAQQTPPANVPSPDVTPASNAPGVPPLPGPFISGPGRSPVDLFRELLAVQPLERLKLLSSRPPATRKLILAKVREYQALKPEQRELRLLATDLRWYLWPLMGMEPSNRATRLALVPEDLRKLVEDRLQAWDSLTPERQKELRDNEATLRYFTEMAASTPEQQQQMQQDISPARRDLLERGISQWQALPESQRDRITARFNQFFELTPEEKAKTLSSLSEPERQQIQKTLEKFGNLTPVQRAVCLRSFGKFASLSLEERQGFLKSAEKWKSMSPAERQSWRELVARLQVDPAVKPPNRKPPPLPPLIGLRRHVAFAGTNDN